MTARELAAAVRPLKEGATAILRFAQIADEAIQLETKLSGLGLAQKELADAKAKVAETQATLAALTAEAQTHTASLAAERAAALAATQREQAELLRVAQAELAQARSAAEGWQAQTRAAEMQHTARVTALRAEETALERKIERLRDLARQMAQAAEAVSR